MLAPSRLRLPWLLPFVLGGLLSPQSTFTDGVGRRSQGSTQWAWQTGWVANSTRCLLGVLLLSPRESLGELGHQASWVFLLLILTVRWWGWEWDTPTYSYWISCRLRTLPLTWNHTQILLNRLKGKWSPVLEKACFSRPQNHVNVQCPFKKKIAFLQKQGWQPLLLTPDLGNLWFSIHLGDTALER